MLFCRSPTRACPAFTAAAVSGRRHNDGQWACSRPRQPSGVDAGAVGNILAPSPHLPAWLAGPTDADSFSLKTGRKAVLRADGDIQFGSYDNRYLLLGHSAPARKFQLTDESLGVATDIFHAVLTGTSRYGVAPIENSTNGPVKETQDCLKKHHGKVHELERIKLRIGHSLLCSHQAAAPVERIYSHEQVSCVPHGLDPAHAQWIALSSSQGIGQCRRYLQDRYPSAKISEVNSTAAAAELASKDVHALAVCSLLCAEVYDLAVVDTDIQDGEGALEMSSWQERYRRRTKATAGNETTFIKFHASV